MITLTIKPSPDLNAWPEALQATEDDLNKAVVRALNKTVRWARTQVARDTAAALSVNVTPIKNSLMVNPAKRTKLEATLRLPARSSVIKVAAMGSPKQNSKGVRVGKRQFDHAFMATMPTGHQGVFRRRGKTRLPIQEVQLVITGKMREVIDDLYDGHVRHQFEKLLERELRYLLAD